MSTTSQLTAYIYGMCDPVTQQLRYVGKSKNPVVRGYQHVCKSQLKPKTHKNHWVKGLLALGLKPEVFVIEQVPPEQWCEAEMFWIAYFKSIGASLTNATAGGDGQHGMSAETRKKIGDACRGKKKPMSDEHKAKIAAANRARWADPVWRDENRKKFLLIRNNSGYKHTEETKKKISETKRLARLENVSH